MYVLIFSRDSLHSATVTPKRNSTLENSRKAVNSNKMLSVLFQKVWTYILSQFKAQYGNKRIRLTCISHMRDTYTGKSEYLKSNTFLDDRLTWAVIIILGLARPDLSSRRSSLLFRAVKNHQGVAILRKSWMIGPLFLIPLKLKLHT